MTSLVRFTHSLENLLDRLRSSQMQATGEVIDLLLRSVDVLRELVAADADAAMPAAAMELEKRIEAVQPAEPAQEETLSEEAPEPVQDDREIRLYSVEFRPDRELFDSGTNPIVLLRNLAALGAVSC